MALLTAALSVGAHALAHGGGPSGAGVALVAVVAATIGAQTVTGARHDSAAALAALLSAGQLLNHLALAVSGHSHPGLPAPAMVAAHGAAVLVGAALIAMGGRLCGALSRVVRALSTASPAQPPTTGVTTTSDQPLQSLLVLLGSMSHRGPPADAVR
ncbi:MAG TPA: hypothetical protein VH496_04840 [Mycobacterium sp.]